MKEPRSSRAGNAALAVLLALVIGCGVLAAERAEPAGPGGVEDAGPFPRAATLPRVVPARAP